MVYAMRPPLQRKARSFGYPQDSSDSEKQDKPKEAKPYRVKLSEAKTLDETSPLQLYLMSGMDNIPRSMTQTRFYHWGFVIYRCAYGDDALWGRYLEYMKTSVSKTLERRQRRGLLEQYLEWTVMDNRKRLEGASKADVKKLFHNWYSNRSETRDGVGMD
ncbi:hypothetical protein B0T22DRAFT_473349 [Podospora appendiculata]|uniref:Uncharacterized protein n=1 Tax=Podospora appendiculata TaxID=314037 RepID=A0AAE0WZA1_9PEZI|nr:hypothetical protein B0T22DRAFT_473349 [Podospora appendiculata]